MFTQRIYLVPALLAHRADVVLTVQMLLTCHLTRRRALWT